MCCDRCGREGAKKAGTTRGSSWWTCSCGHIFLARIALMESLYVVVDTEAAAKRQQGAV